MATAAAQYYFFGFAFVDVTVFRMSKSISKPNQISSAHLNSQLIYNYFRFIKQTSAISEFYSGFDLCCFTVTGVLFCMRLPNFVQIEPPPIFNMAAISHVVLMADNP